MGVMVGRGAQGRPWALAEIAAAVFGAPAPMSPKARTLTDDVARHYEDMLSFYGRVLGPRVARKHLGWYMDGAGTPGPCARHPDGNRPAEGPAPSSRRDRPGAATVAA
jgi:tRNA-dihydrouridine synthase B